MNILWMVTCLISFMKRIDWKKGSGEFVACAVICPLICAIVIIMCSYIQLTISLRQLTNALNVCGRSASVCTSLEDAEKQSLLVAESAINNRNISDIHTKVEYANGDKEWNSGVLLLVTISARIETVAPYLTSGIRIKKTIVSVENSTLETSDINLLAATIATESSPSDEKGMLAVGTVIMNRVDSPSYPNTLYDVIYQSGQFAVTWESSNFKKYVLNGAPDEAVACAQKILKGERTEILKEQKCTQFRTHKYYDGNGHYINSENYHPRGIDISGNWFFW